MNNPENATVALNMIDLTGRPVDVRIESMSEDNIYTLDTERITQGLYILRVNVGTETKLIKVMKE